MTKLQKLHALLGTLALALTVNTGCAVFRMTAMWSPDITVDDLPGILKVRRAEYDSIRYYHGELTFRARRWGHDPPLPPNIFAGIPADAAASYREDADFIAAAPYSDNSGYCPIVVMQGTRVDAYLIEHSSYREHPALSVGSSRWETDYAPASFSFDLASLISAEHLRHYYFVLKPFGNLNGRLYAVPYENGQVSTTLPAFIIWLDAMHGENLVKITRIQLV